MSKRPAVYIMASKQYGTLYTGVTGDLVKRVYEHRNNIVKGFTQKHAIHDLVYFELHEEMHSAIIREKQIKKWKRRWKIELIEKNNPDWNDLWDVIIL